MNVFIIVFGRSGREIVYARDLDAATQKAREFAQSAGLSAEDSHDESEVWAEIYDWHRARDLNLTWLDEQERGWQTKEART